MSHGFAHFLILRYENPTVILMHFCKQHIAYEYAKRGAFLVIGARRENALSEVAERAFMLGSPGVVPLQIDVSDDQESRRLIEEAINQFGRCM